MDSARGSCRVTLDATSIAQPWDQDVDWNIWAAAVAIDAMCWRQGKNGIATVGKDHRRAFALMRLERSRQLMMQQVSMAGWR